MILDVKKNKNCDIKINDKKIVEKTIKEMLEKTKQLEVKLKGEDKMTLQWLTYGYNDCAKMLNEKEEENEKYNEIISKTIDYIQKHIYRIEGRWLYNNYVNVIETLELDNKELVELLEILRGEENEDIN